MELTQILQKALEIGGSDIFLIPGSAATAKVKGHLVQLTEEKLLPADTADMIREAYGMAGDHSDVVGFGGCDASGGAVGLGGRGGWHGRRDRDR